MKPLTNRVPPSRYIVPLPLSWGPPVASVPDVNRSDLVKYGAYFAGPVAHCMDCHTPRRSDGQPDLSKLGAGGFAFRGHWGVSYSLNLTPDPDTGMGKWGEGEIIVSILGARRGGGQVLPPMPVGHYAAGIRPEDVKAIIAYLGTLAPVRNAVPPAEPPQKP